MKLSSDPRHQKRRAAVKSLFANSFAPQGGSELAKAVLAKTTELDKLIEAAAPQWPVDKINKIDMAVLRLAVYELLEGNTPEKVVVDEAVELAKEYGGESSPSFINGVLGTVIESLHKHG